MKKKTLVIVSLAGGLGNQMFQYAFGRALALHKDSDLALNLESFHCDRKRKYALNCFNLIGSLEFFNEYSEGGYLIGRVIFKLKKLYRKWVLRYRYSVINETSIFKSISSFDELDDVELIGYWQDERYFFKFAEEIKKEFTWKACLPKSYSDLISPSGGSVPVAIHVRRGDYVSEKDTAKYHGFLGIHYYISAMKYIQARIINPHFYIFTDDIPWAKENLSILKNVTIASNSEATEFEDMHMISKCQHAIVANSSFSWWGAWLIESKEKIVVAPSVWFKSGSINAPPTPSDWILI